MLKSRLIEVLWTLVFALMLIWSISCATGEKSQESDDARLALSTPSASPSPSITIPSYTALPQPHGYDINDLQVIFLSPKAPERATLDNCDETVQSLLLQAKSDVEVTRGIEELVRKNADTLHWCFYSKLLDIEEVLKSDQYIDEKQKAILTGYQFLVPIARGFMKEYQDSRYLRWAVRRYRRISETVFHRPLELSPEETAELVETTDPFYGWREQLEFPSVIDKYKLKSKETPLEHTVQTGQPKIRIEKDPLKPQNTRTPASTPASSDSSEFSDEFGDLEN